MDWQSFLKKYVWDDDKTPYFVPVQRLTRTQANHELFSYTFFMALLFAAIAIFSLTENALLGKSHVAALYALSVASCAVLLGATKHPYAAYYVALAPLAALARFLLGGFPPDFAAIDKGVLIAVAAALLVYSMRVVAIAKRYPDMPGVGPKP